MMMMVMMMMVVVVVVISIYIITVPKVAHSRQKADQNTA